MQVFFLQKVKKILRKFRGLDLLTVFHCVRDKSYCNFKDLIQKNMFEYDSFPKTFL